MTNVCVCDWGHDLSDDTMSMMSKCKGGMQSAGLFSGQSNLDGGMSREFDEDQ